MLLAAPAPVLAPPIELVELTLPALLNIRSLYIFELVFLTLVPLILELNAPEAEFTLTEDFWRLRVWPWEVTELVRRLRVELCL